MQVTINPGMRFAGTQGTPDRQILTLNKQERATLEKARAVCEQADDLLRADDPDEINEWSLAAMWLGEIIMTGEWTVKTMWETVTV